ncbi:MAG: preprotein translocase subunit SecG [Patescibacteria group bacterium]|nr:preprotein translocase subunit SecG [Patescibacteria group bacterium]
MSRIFQLIEVFSAITLIASILLQQRGTGLSSIFGGEGSSYRTKRGAEKFLFWTTIIMAIVFFGTTFLSLVLFAK